MPHSGADVPDDLETRLVVLSADHAYSKEPGNAAECAAKALLESRGNTPRLFRNSLVFLAADKVRLQDLDEAVRKFLAWDSILAERNLLDLSPHQVKQAETQREAADSAVEARLPETWQWLLVPVQTTPQTPMTREVLRLTGTDALAVRTSKKLRSEDLLIMALGATILRKHLDDVPLWSGNHVAIRQLVEHFARYVYLPRLAGPDVLVQAIRDGIALLTWQTDGFAYAESFDEGVGRYRGLRCGKMVTLTWDDHGLIVKPGVAWQQMEAERPQLQGETQRGSYAGTTEAIDKGDPGGSIPESQEHPGGTANTPARPARPRRFYGAVRLDPTRTGRDASRIADEVIAHLAGLAGAEVTVTLEIEAMLPEGATEQVIRVVTENSRSLKFDPYGFERE